MPPPPPPAGNAVARAASAPADPPGGTDIAQGNPAQGNAPQDTPAFQWTPKQDLLLLRAISRRIDLNEHGAKVWTRLRQDFKAYKVNGPEPTLEQTLQRCHRLRWSEKLYEDTWQTFPGSLRWNKPFGNDNRNAPPLDRFAGGSALLCGEEDEDSEDGLTMVDVRQGKEAEDGEGSREDEEGGGGGNGEAQQVETAAQGDTPTGQPDAITAAAQGQAPQAQPQQPPADIAASTDTASASSKRPVEYFIETEPNKRVRFGIAPLPDTKVSLYGEGNVVIQF